MGQSFPEFAGNVAVGLGRAIQTDEDVFLLASMGLFLGSRYRSFQGIGKAIGLYVIVRRVDKIAGYFAQVIGE